jgi:hypothetical protein
MCRIFVAFQQTRGLDLSSSRTSETISAERGDGCGANLDIALHCGRVNDHRQSRYTGLQITDKSDQNGIAVIPRSPWLLVVLCAWILIADLCG